MSTSLLNRLRDTGPSISLRGNGRGGTQVEDALAQGRGVDTPGHPPRIHLPANEGRCVDERGGRPTPKNMTPKSFYPALTLSRIRAVEERVLRFLADVRLGRKRKRGQGDEESEALMRYWKQFSSQAAAFEEADRLDPTYQTLRTFSLQMTLSGTRKFLITSYIELWSRYALMPPRCRHFYEIVRENKPCHLYFGK